MMTEKRGRPATGTAQTSARRQKAYRERVKRLAAPFADDRQQGSARLSLWLPASVCLAVTRMARLNGYTKAETIARLITEAERITTHGMTTEEIDGYYSLRRNDNSRDPILGPETVSSARWDTGQV